MTSANAYAQGPPAAASPGRPGQQQYQQHVTSSGNKNADFKEGKIFLGGLNFSTTADTLQQFCSKWCEHIYFAHLVLHTLLYTIMFPSNARASFVEMSDASHLTGAFCSEVRAAHWQQVRQDSRSSLAHIPSFCEAGQCASCIRWQQSQHVCADSGSRTTLGALVLFDHPACADSSTLPVLLVDAFFSHSSEAPAMLQMPVVLANGSCRMHASCRGAVSDVCVIEGKGYGFVTFADFSAAFAFLEVSESGIVEMLHIVALYDFVCHSHLTIRLRLTCSQVCVTRAWSWEHVLLVACESACCQADAETRVALFKLPAHTALVALVCSVHFAMVVHVAGQVILPCPCYCSNMASAAPKPRSGMICLSYSHLLGRFCSLCFWRACSLVVRV